LQARVRQCVPANYKGAVSICLGDGEAAEEILAAARLQACDLIVMGTHGRSGFSRLLMGSVAEAVVRGASCPVMTIKPSIPAPAAPLTETKAEPVIDANALVTVATAANAVDADIIQNALRSEGIRCFSEGMNQAGLTGTLGV
jgi:hypothetical protein